MIISASRRTDIPCFYSEWFFYRIKEKYVLVRQPFNRRQVRKIVLSPETVDGIVFYTKNPLPMLDRLELLRDYAYYFQFTLTSYGSDVEKGIPSKNDIIIPAFRNLADLLGPDRIIWRYDPIFLSSGFSIDDHAEHFERIAEKLEGYTKKCTISFLDRYRHIEGRLRTLKLTAMEEQQQVLIARILSDCARRHGIKLETCAESIDLGRYGIGHARCVDRLLLEKISGGRIVAAKDKNQRPYCGCCSSVDIGTYNTCANGCVYCYANRSDSSVGAAAEKYDPLSPILCGELREGDRITERPVKSNMSEQFQLSGDV